MKSLKLLIALFTIPASFAQTFEQTSAIDVADGLGNFHPQIETLSDGTPAVIWTNSSDKSIYFAKHDGSSAFLPAIKLNPDGLNIQAYNWSGADLAIEGDNIYVIFRSEGYTTGNIFMVKSTDNGASFSDTVRVDQLTTGFGQYPDIAVYNDTIWTTFMDHDAGGADPQYVVSRSTDGGLTFETEVAVSTAWGAEACDCCQPEIIANENKVVVFFRNNDANTRDIKAVASLDRGATFSQTFSVDDHNWFINSCPSTGPDARFDSNGDVLATYKTYVSGESRIYLQGYDIDADMTTGGVQIEDVASSNAQINYPQIDYKDGIMGIVWEAAGQSIDVFINFSETGIAGIDAANAFNLTNASGAQNKPDIAVGDAYFHVVYADGLNLKYIQVTPLLSLAEETTPFVSTFPNPASDKVIFEVPGADQGFTVGLYDLNGKEVLVPTAATSNKLSLDVSGLPQGLYHYILSTNAKTYQGSLVIE